MYAYRFAGYWRDVGTIDSLWEANMEVLDPENSGIDIFDEKWKIDVYKRQLIHCFKGFLTHFSASGGRIRHRPEWLQR